MSRVEINKKPLEEYSKEELIKLIEGVFDIKNAEVKTLEAQNEMYKKLLLSPHRIWSDFGSNALSIIFYCFLLLSIGYLFGVK